jgi:hypothetical protein
VALRPIRYCAVLTSTTPTNKMSKASFARRERVVPPTYMKLTRGRQHGTSFPAPASKAARLFWCTRTRHPLGFGGNREPLALPPPTAAHHNHPYLRTACHPACRQTSQPSDQICARGPAAKTVNLVYISAERIALVIASVAAAWHGSLLKVCTSTVLPHTSGDSHGTSRFTHDTVRNASSALALL